jgi:hypothetical protein
MNEQEQQMMEQQYQDSPYQNYPVPMVQRNDKADMIDKINPTLIVEVIRHKLMGQELIDGEWRELPHLKQRAISEIGAWDIANLMLGVSSQNVSISKLNDNEIRQRTLYIVKTMSRMLLDDWRAYGIKNTSQFFFVKEIVISNTFITLKQPEGEVRRKLLMGTTHEQTLHSDQDRNRKKGFLSGLIRGG